jgi:uncharacterized protein YyaL (SSP411 family)
MAQASDDRSTNRLAHETSAYLRQHMHNPVDWRPWGEEALAAAREADKPLLVSIGYSACHWCHVMERESFEDPATAELMNRLFVPVKVDREERPDVDQIYMDTVVRLHGHGGWPLTVFCTPDGRPFYGGTYFPPEARHGLPAFRRVLEAVHRAYHEQRDEVDETARRILDALAARPHGMAEQPPGRDLLLEGARRLLDGADRRRGGFGGAPKFPMPTSLELLLAAEPWLPPTEAADLRDFLRRTAHAMARRGLYDPLAGGFHRYCVDAQWSVPHFEKMLYDQGQLLRFYADLWRRTGGDDEDLVWPVRETADWLRREMCAPDGGFFASQDADSEGEEGRFYVWTPAQVEEVLGAEAAAAFCRAFDVTPEGNFEGSNVLHDVSGAPRERFAAERAALREARSRRVPPDTDRKRVASWNALTVSGLAYAGSVLPDEAMLADARAAGEFLVERMRDGGRLHRVYAEGAVRVPGFLDDVAATLVACLDLHRAGAGAPWLPAALRLAEEVVERFFDEEEGDLFLTPSDGERLVHRPRSDHDGATPASTGLAVLGLVRVCSLADRRDLRGVAERVLRTHADAASRLPHAHPTLLRAAAWLETGPSVAVVTGDPDAEATRALARAARRRLAPDEAVVVAAPGGAVPEGLDPSWLEGRREVERPTAWICRGTACSLPAHDPEALAPLPG